MVGSNFHQRKKMIIEADYHSISKTANSEIKIKGSRFIAIASPAETGVDAGAFLSVIVDEYPDATHHCYAYRVFDGNRVSERSSDAGEPAGSAGAPMLTVLKGHRLLAIIVVVVRYFGGVKLGVGGLIRAYTEATQMVLDKCVIVQHIRQTIIAISFPYEQTGAVMHIIAQAHGEIVDMAYDTLTRLKVQLPVQLADNFKKQLIDATSNQIVINPWN
jgi:uncharacterized YigZ family protein